MKTSGTTTALVLFASGTALALATAAPNDDVALMKQAKITKNEAKHFALAKVPHGQIKSAEIEKGITSR